MKHESFDDYGIFIAKNTVLLKVLLNCVSSGYEIHFPLIIILIMNLS